MIALMSADPSAGGSISAFLVTLLLIILVIGFGGYWLIKLLKAVIDYLNRH